MSRPIFTRLDLLRFLKGRPFYFMLALLVVEAVLAALVTWLIIQAGRDVADDEFLITDLIWILLTQSASYAVGATSWIFAERAGFAAYGRYMQRFARDNRHWTKLFNEKTTREQVEPFLTGETFHVFFETVYELEFGLKLLFGLIFNIIVFGAEIDGSMPIAYILVFVVLFAMQWLMRRRVAAVYLENQRMQNRMTAHGYTAWDNVFSGNRYNLRLWLAGFKLRLRQALAVQIRAILTREGLSAASGIIGLSIVFATMVFVATRNIGDTALLVGLAATLPKQIELTQDVQMLASGWNDLLALWARMQGVSVNMRPDVDPHYDERIRFDRLTIKEDDATHVCHSVHEALAVVLGKQHGRVQVRGGNGSGKSTLLAALKSELKGRGYYFPTTDRLAFNFVEAARRAREAAASDDEDETELHRSPRRLGFSSGERQLKSLQEITACSSARVYLLDEWDANLDSGNRDAAEAMVQQLAARARVVEISHRDRV
jgi:ABC-type transport system involved in cytochrome c biogenesis ATPase subunit